MSGEAITFTPTGWIGSTTAARNPDTHSQHEGISPVEIDGQKMLFTDLIAKDPEYFLGAAHVARFGQQPMLLVKLLDAAVRLQFQAHPTAEFARSHLDSNSGKAEAYYILDVRDDAEDAFAYLGFQRPPAREDFRRWIEEQDIAAIESCFDKINVKPGDVLFIPGGVPHAIGGAIELETFGKFFVPAGLGVYQIEAAEEVHILECFPPTSLNR